jgi:hypothetical protein
VFMAVFMSYAHSFGVPRWFARPMTLSTLLRGMIKNLSFLCFRVVSLSYCPRFWGFQTNLQGPWHLVHVWEAWQKTRGFCVWGPFSWAIVRCFGVSWRFTRNMTVCRF